MLDVDEMDVVVKVIPSASTDVTRSVRATDGTAVRSGHATVSCVGGDGVFWSHLPPTPHHGGASASTTRVLLPPP